MEVDFSWKVVIAGSGGVGKSTFLHRFFKEVFKHDMTMTIGCSHMSQVVQRNGRAINLIIWDLGGQKRFDVLHPAYVGDTMGALVFFDMTEIGTIDEIKKWIDLLRHANRDKDLPVVLVGTKMDLIYTQEELDGVYALVRERMAELGLEYVIVTSAKTNYNVSEAMDFFIDLMLWYQDNRCQE